MPTEQVDGKASGDVQPSEKPSPAQPSTAQPPDVELIEDGFGFMPKEHPAAKTASTKVNKGGKVAAPTKLEEEEKRSSCASSTNTDIVRRYTWKTKNRMTVQVISYGATITSISVPDRKGVPDDVLAGFDTLEEYLQTGNPYFGATLGRYANVIRNGTVVVRPSGKTYMLSTNRHYDHYNGGYIGFDKVNWRSYVTGNKVIMSHVSERFSEGYPGTVMAQVTFEVTCDNTIKICMKCTTSEPTIVNLSNSLFFNLGGHHTGSETLCDHIITINADKFTAISEDGYVTGEKKVVGGTPYDFRIPRMLKVMLPKIPMGGYDLNYCVTQGTEQELTFQARALHPFSGRVMEIYSNQPGLQFYTGNKLPDPDKIVENFGVGDSEEQENEETKSVKSEATEKQSAESIEEASQGQVSYGYVPLMGKNGTYYKKHGLLSFMPQNFPDAVNHRNFPNSVLNPGEEYVHKIQYKFGLLLGRYI